jgi:tetratricopeptide (TPR) repeat protein
MQALARTTAALAAADPAPEEEERLIRQGIELRKAGDDLAASEIFRRAYDRSRSPRAAAQLGIAEQALGRWEDADIHITEALRAKGDPWIEKNRAAIERSAGVIKAHLARIHLVGEPSGAEVLFNGRSVGTLPLAGPISVSVGEIDVELRAPGYVSANRRVTLVAGQYQRMVLRLEKAAAKAEPAAESQPASSPPAAAVAAASPPTQPPPPSAGVAVAVAPLDQSPPRASSGPSARKVIKWGAFALGAAGLVTGVVASVIHESKASEFKSAEGGGCRDRDHRAVDVFGDPVPACQPILDSYYGARTWQIVGFASAGVFGLAGLVLALTEPQRPAAARTSWSCGPSSSGLGGSCALRF